MMSTKTKYMLYMVGSILLLIMSVATLNFTGFCFSQFRFLTEQEIIEIAVKDVMKTHNLMNKVHYEKVGGEYVEAKGRFTNKIIRYQSVEEFLKVNQNCCEVRGHTERNKYTASLITKLFGNFKTFVKVKYLIRFYNDNGVVMTKPSSTYVAVTNCGKAWSGF